MAVLKQIKFPGMQEAVQIAVTQLERIDKANNAITLESSNTAVGVDGHPLYKIGLAIDGKTIVKDENEGLKSGLQLVYHAAKQEGDKEQSAHIALTDNAGKELSVIPVSNIVGNGVLNSSAYDAATGILTLTFAQADGTTKAVDVDLKAMLDINDMSIAEGSKDYLEVKLGTADGEGATQAVFGAKTVKVAEATVSKTGLVDAKDVKDYVDNAATGLAVSAQGDDYITAAIDAQNNKKINVSADVQNLTASAGSAGVYDANGKETTSPVAGSLSGTANSLVDGADVAAKVKTYVDGAITIEVARADAKVLAAIKALKVNDTAKDGKYVSAVSETDGKVVISRANVADAVLNGYAKGSAPDSGKEAVAATDDVKGAISKLEHQVDAAKAAATAAVKALDATVGSTTVETGKHVAVEVVETDGKLTGLTVTESDIASNAALDAEIAARKAVDGQEGQTYVANTRTNYISGATSLNDADIKLDAALKAEADRAKLAETSIDSVVGLTKAADDETRTYTNEGEYIGKAQTNTVASDIKALDTKLNEVAGKLAGVQYQVSGTTLEFFGINPKA